MSTALLIAGALFELAGLVVVFVELSTIRSDEFGEPTPWAKLGRRLCWWRRRPQTVNASGAAVVAFGGSATARVRPGALPDDATDTQRVTRVERYVEHIDEDLITLRDTIDKRITDAIAQAKKADDSVRNEFQAREAERRAALRRSMRWQAAGAMCVLLGLVLGTAGNLW